MFDPKEGVPSPRDAQGSPVFVMEWVGGELVGGRVNARRS